MFHKGHRELNSVVCKPTPPSIWIARILLVGAAMLLCGYVEAIVNAILKLLGG